MIMPVTTMPVTIMPVMIIATLSLFSIAHGMMHPMHACIPSRYTQHTPMHAPSAAPMLSYYYLERQLFSKYQCWARDTQRDEARDDASSAGMHGACVR